jgi:hypothetical protein
MMTWRRVVLAGVVLAAVMVAGAPPRAAGPKFFDDDPIAREPETMDASGAKPWTIGLLYDLGLNLFAKPGDKRLVRAGDVNTIDEVPDSSWFTNRVLAHPIALDDMTRGPVTQPGPAPGRLTVTRAKPAGVTPGFVMQDARGVLWFVQFDARGWPEAASGATVVSNRLFHAIGYWQTENHVAYIRREDLSIGPKAMVDTSSGRKRRLSWGDLDTVMQRAEKQRDGSYRIMASRAVPGTPLGGFKYNGTRPDDPNDVVPHEHRRALRALRVFGAWLNLVDMKAGNTLDAIVDENGKRRVRHYLQDVGSTLGDGGVAPRDYDEGFEALLVPNLVWKRLVSFGFYTVPWQHANYSEYRSVGRIEAEAFDPATWTPRVPPASWFTMRPDDAFWAARRVAAFSDDMIRAAVRAGQYSDKVAETFLGDMIIARRDKIARAYLPAVNPLVDFSLDGQGTLRFENAAVEAGVSKDAAGYRATWKRFDNATGDAQAIGETTGAGRTLPAPGGLSTSPGSYLLVEVCAVDPTEAAWTKPVSVYFRRLGDGWKLVGLERLPETIE